MSRLCAVSVVPLLAITLVGSPAQAQWGDPFASLDHSSHPRCPFDCDSVTLVLSGELASTNWNPPEMMSWTRVGDSIDVRVRVEFKTDAGLPVLVPFELEIPLGLLAEGSYRVSYTVYIDNPMATMPMVPFLNITDRFAVAPPGEQNCDGIFDVSDVVDLIVYVFRNGSPPDPARRADVNCDGRSDIGDVIQLIYAVFRGGTVCDPCPTNGMLPLSITDLPPDSLRRDSFELLSASASGDSLHLRIAHSGGCLLHGYAVYWPSMSFEEPPPRIAHLYPQHTDPGDPCDAWPTVDLEVDFRVLILVYRFIYGYDFDAIVLRVHGFDPATHIDVLYNLPPLPQGPNAD